MYDARETESFTQARSVPRVLAVDHRRARIALNSVRSTIKDSGQD